MIKNLAVKYKKIHVLENLYIYKYAGTLENVIYDGLNDSITYMKNGKKIEIYDMEDEVFNISGEKYCFSDYIEIDVLKDMYGIDDEEQIKEIYTEEALSFVRYAVYDPEKETFKIIHSNRENIEKAEADSEYPDYYLVSTNEDEGMAICIKYDILNQMIDKIEDGNVERVLNMLLLIKEQIDAMTMGSIEEYEEKLANKDKKIETNTNREILIKESIDKLNDLTGLENIKLFVQKLANYLIFLEKTQGEIELEKPKLNMVFKGNPGTGKTTVAKILAEIFYSLGYIEKNQFVEATAEDFIGGYVGQTATKAKGFIKKHSGGVILVDEAYVFSSKAQEYASEALVEILKELEKQNTIFIFAGYEKEMDNFIKMNPGLNSRIAFKLSFEDYSIDELTQIFNKKIEKSKLKITDEALVRFKEEILQAMKEKTFGNARYVNSLFDKLILSHANNTNNTNNIDELKTITEDDFNGIEKEKVKIKMGF